MKKFSVVALICLGLSSQVFASSSSSTSADAPRYVTDKNGQQRLVGISSESQNSTHHASTSGTPEKKASTDTFGTGHAVDAAYKAQAEASEMEEKIKAASSMSSEEKARMQKKLQEKKAAAVMHAQRAAMADRFRNSNK